MEVGEETPDELRNEYAKVGRQNCEAVSAESLREMASHIRRENATGEPKVRLVALSQT